MRLRERYVREVVPAWCAADGLRSPLAVPRVTKVTLNMGVKDAANDKAAVPGAVDDLTRIAGQQAVVSKARKSVAGFKLREGVPIGAFVSLRGRRMYAFLEVLINIAIPRMRDFRGLPARSFDGRGNYSMGIPEQIVFPEINIERVHRIRGLDVSIVTNAGSDAAARRLLLALGLPLR